MLDSGRKTKDLALTIAMKTAQKAFIDLWVLSTSVSVTCSIMTITFLLYVLSFSPGVTENEKATVVGIFVALSVVFAYGYWQVLKAFKVYKNVLDAQFKDHPDIGSSSNSNAKKENVLKLENLQNLSKLCGSPRVRRSSFPMQFQEEFHYHCNRVISGQYGFAPEVRDLFETDLQVASSRNSNDNCLKHSDEVSAILHNCVKDLGDVLEHVRLINNAEGTAKQMNIDGEFQQKDYSNEGELQCLRYSRKSVDTEGYALDIPERFQSLNTAEKRSKIDSSSRMFQNLVASRLLRENLCSQAESISEGINQEFLSKRSFIDTEEIEPFLLKIPSDSSKLCSVMNLKSEASLPNKKIPIQFYKRKSQVKQIVLPKSTTKKCVSKFPMKPYMWKIPRRQYVLENLKKLPKWFIPIEESPISKDPLIISSNVPIISSNEQVVSSNSATLSKDLSIIPNKAPIFSVGEILMSMNETLNAHINEPLFTSMNEPLISKFTPSELKNFADIFNFYSDYCSLYQAI